MHTETMIIALLLATEQMHIYKSELHYTTNVLGVTVTIATLARLGETSREQKNKQSKA